MFVVDKRLTAQLPVNKAALSKDEYWPHFLLKTSSTFFRHAKQESFLGVNWVLNSQLQNVNIVLALAYSWNVLSFLKKKKKVRDW